VYGPKNAITAQRNKLSAEVLPITLRRQL